MSSAGEDEISMRLKIELQLCTLLSCIHCKTLLLPKSASYLGIRNEISKYERYFISYSLASKTT